MDDDRVKESLVMLEAFASVGIRRFNLTQTTIDRGRVPNGYRPGRNLAAMRLMLSQLVPRAWDLHQNLIVRAWDAPGAVLAQLDDLDSGKLVRARLWAFLAVETSPGNYQAWLSIAGGTKDVVDSLKRGFQADPRANCSGRVAGSPNCKPKYLPDFPMVRIVSVNSGRQVQPAEIEGELAPREPARFWWGSAKTSRDWPDYERCLRGAPHKKDGTPDRSSADFVWCKWALDRGHPPAAVMARLLEVSEKGRQEWQRGNENYVLRTVESAGRL